MMGAGHVKTVFAEWGDLKGPAFRLLVFVATLMPDRDARPRCELSRQNLAIGLGYKELDDRADRALSRAIQSLLVAKVWEIAQAASPGRRAHYWVNLSMERRTHLSSVPSKPVVRSLDTSVRSRRTVLVATVDRSVHREPVDTVLPLSGVVLQDLSQEKEGLTAARTSRDASTNKPQEFSDDKPPATAPPLRVVARNPSPPVVTATVAKQPALWPAAVPDPHREDTVNAAEARAEIRAALKGRSNAPITRAGRERQRAAVVPAPLISADRSATPQDRAKIFGPGPTDGAWRPAHRGDTPGALVPGDADPPPPIARRTPREGHGFCVPCYDQGHITLATDPDSGSTCDRHAAAVMAS
jgi:hypothetical protein